MKLYWVTTEDHCEDWFVIASTSKSASRWFERNEGYDSGEASAVFVIDVPDDFQLEFDEYEDEACWPSESVLIDLGAKYINHDPTRIVEISGKRYCEGMLEAIIRMKNDDQFELLGQGRPNGTIPGSKMKN